MCFIKNTPNQISNDTIQKIEVILSDVGKLLTHIQEIDKLQEKEAILKDMTNNLPIGMITANCNGDILSVNPFLVKVLGSPSEEATRQFNILTSPPLVKNGVSALLEQCISTKEIVVSELPYHSSWGKELYMRVTIVPVKDEEGNVTHCHALVEDITEKKQVKQELLESEQIFEMITESAKDAIIVIDNDSNITIWNKAAENIFGYSQEEAIGSNPHELIIADKYEKIARRGFEHFKQTGQGNAIGKTLEMTAKNKNGDYFPIELSLSSLKLKNKWNAVGIVRDITERKKAEEELKQSEENYREVLASIDSVIWKADISSQGELINPYISPVVEKLLCVETNSIGSDWEKYMKFVHPDDLPNIYSYIEDAIKEPGKLIEMEYRVTRGDNKKHWFYSKGSSKVQPDGTLKISGTTIDITNEKIARETIKERDERLQSIFRAAPTGIGMVSNRKLKEVNERVARITGYTKEELIGQDAKILYPCDEDYNYVGTEKYDQIRKYGSGTVETRWKRKDGSVVDILLSSTPIDQKNLSKGITFTALDITSRKLMENALKESQERCRSVVDQIAESIFAYDLKGNIILVNDLASKSTGYSKDELLTMNISDLCPYQQCENNGNEIEYKAVVLEVDYRKKDGSTYPVEVKVTPISFAGKPIILALTRDISESKRAKEAMLTAKIAAEAANRTKSEFLANMSHELRTPLNSVIGFSEVMIKQASWEMNPTQRKYLNNIHKNGKQLLILINNILTLSKIETGEMDLKYTIFHPKKIIDDIISIAGTAANKKSIEIISNVGENVHNIESDLTKFNTILYNILSNAIKFTPNNGNIIIETKIVDEKLQVSVTDTGIGIEKEDIDIIFRPFEQIDSSTTRKFGGTGIGLVLVKKYLDMQNGDIWVESEHDNGSTFTFVLPLKPETIYQEHNLA